MPNTFNVARAIYLAATTKVTVPQNLLKYVPIVTSQLNGVAAHGISGWAAKNGESESSLTELYDKGNTGVPATAREYKDILAEQIRSELTSAHTNQKIDNETFDKSISQLVEFINSGTTYGSVGVITPQTVEEENGISYIHTNFYPVEGLIGAMPEQSFTYFSGVQKTGKSRLLLAFGLHLMREGICDEFHFYENEYPRDAMITIARPFFKHYKSAGKNIQIKCETINYQSILDKYREEPNPNRVVIFDSPDVSVAGQEGDVRHIQHEKPIQLMLQMRELNKFVLASSQLNRGSGSEPTSNNFAESSQKARFMDLGIAFVSNDETKRGSVRQLSANVLDSRYTGIVSPTNKIGFDFNYVTGEIVPIVDLVDY